MTSESLVIPASKTRTLLLIVLGLGFVALGLWFLSLDPLEIEARRRFNNPTLFYGLGFVTILFFGLCVVAGTWRLISSKPGLTLDRKGVTIYAIGQDMFIPWSDVSGLSTYEVQRQKMLVLDLRDPNKYIEVGGKLRRWLAKANYNLCGSPVAISSSLVKLNFDELRELFGQYVERHGGPS